MTYDRRMELNALRDVVATIEAGEAAKAKRDKLIVELRRDGHDWESICQAAGISRAAAHAAAKRANGGELPIPERLRKGARSYN